ncbi:uncharacterized protein LOC141898896 [Tubulanus polymorphus]|uniref:uncharacterized protein LOC141898896 n=1 Tax=Tubulanus polymorphus TaxID=672921 RepID=UPI003DA2E020
MGDHILKSVTSITYLGITLSSNMKWDLHINSAVASASRTLGFLMRNLKYAPRQLKATAYKSLVRSKLEYAGSVWDPHLVKDVDALEKVQRRAARFVMPDYKRTSSVSTMLEHLDWPQLADRRRHCRISMMQKILNQETAIPKDHYITTGLGKTRRRNDFKLSQFRTSTEEYRNSFFPRTVVEWNASSQETIKEMCSAASVPIT